MFKKLGIFILSLIFICITLSGCQSLVDEKKMSVSKKHTVTDSAGNKVTLPVKPQRIVSLTLGTDEILMDIVAPERIAALTYLSDDSGISHISERSIQVKNKIKGNSAEAILALKPDLVLIADWWGLNILDTLREMGINVYVYKAPYTVADVKKTIREVAFIVGEAERGEQVIKNFDDKIEAVQKKVSGIAGNTNRSVIAITGKGAFGAKGSIYDDMCKYARIKNCLQDLKTDDSTTISKEIIIKENPDVIIVPSWDAPGMLKVQSMKEILNDESLQTVTAVKNKKVHQVPGRCLYCVSPYVADSIEILAKAVYPEVFK